MALTNYLMQTVICVLIFYGYGLGQYGKVGRLDATLLAFAIFLFQIVFSSLWLKYFSLRANGMGVATAYVEEKVKLAPGPRR